MQPLCVCPCVWAVGMVHNLDSSFHTLTRTYRAWHTLHTSWLGFLQCAVLYILWQIRLCVTLQYCVKTREHRGILSSSSGSPVSLVLIDGGWPSPGKIWVQRGHFPRVKTAELYTFYTFRLITMEPWQTAKKVQLMEIESRPWALNQDCASPLTSPNGVRYRNLALFAQIMTKALKVCYKVSLSKSFQRDQLPIERYQHFGRGWPHSREIWAWRHRPPIGRMCVSHFTRGTCAVSDSRPSCSS